MKEAAGEANMTVITIVLIAIVAAIATPLISSLVTNAADRACCNSLGGTVDGGVCSGSSLGDGKSVKGFNKEYCKTTDK